MPSVVTLNDILHTRERRPRAEGPVHLDPCGGRGSRPSCRPARTAPHVGNFVAVGSPEKIYLLQEKYHIPRSHVFYSRDASFAKGVLRITRGRGVNYILNSLSREMLRHSWYCLAPFGTSVEIGMKDLLGDTALDMRPFLKDASFAAINLEHIFKDQLAITMEIFRNTFELLRQGSLRPITPLTVFLASQVEAACGSCSQANTWARI